MMQAEINQEALAKLASAELAYGPHSDRSNGLCALEWVALLANEDHGDHPECACPVVSTFVRSWNDSLSDDDRTRLLRPLVPKLVGSRSTPAVETQRSYLALDWLIREFLPTWLEQVDSLREHAMTIRSLEVIRDMETAEAANESVAAAWGAARAAAFAAAFAAAGAAARDAAGDATGDATRAAAFAAAFAAARDAAGDAAGDAVNPTVVKLQGSAVDLLERMIAIEAEDAS